VRVRGAGEGEREGCRSRGHPRATDGSREMYLFIPRTSTRTTRGFRARAMVLGLGLWF
jgi:hypothetical protein